MKDKNNLKRKISDLIRSKIDARIEAARQSMQSAMESRDNETKSSVGDKYETGRAMMQLELDRMRTQLMQAQSLANEFKAIEVERDFIQAGPGCLVNSDQGNYFLTVGIGKMELEGEEYIAISMQSPIGRMMVGKKAGDSIIFRDKVFRIIELW